MKQSITVIENTSLFNSLLWLEPEYYYRKVPDWYFNEIIEKWKSILTINKIQFNPVMYHKKHETKNSNKVEYIDLEDKQKNTLRIKQESIEWGFLNG